jgi:hypothetical protein
MRDGLNPLLSRRDPFGTRGGETRLAKTENYFLDNPKRLSSIYKKANPFYSGFASMFIRSIQFLNPSRPENGRDWKDASLPLRGLPLNKGGETTIRHLQKKRIPFFRIRFLMSYLVLFLNPSRPENGRDWKDTSLACGVSPFTRGNHRFNKIRNPT